jgi:hypothetical protein
VTAWAQAASKAVQQVFPATVELDANILPRAKEYRRQAIDNLHTLFGSVMLAASAGDVLRSGYRLSSLYSRIDKAKDGLITATWPNGLTKSGSTQTTNATPKRLTHCPDLRMHSGASTSLRPWRSFFSCSLPVFNAV